MFDYSKQVAQLLDGRYRSTASSDSAWTDWVTKNGKEDRLSSELVDLIFEGEVAGIHKARAAACLLAPKLAFLPFRHTVYPGDDALFSKADGRISNLVERFWRDDERLRGGSLQLLETIGRLICLGIDWAVEAPSNASVEEWRRHYDTLGVCLLSLLPEANQVAQMLFLRLRLNDPDGIVFGTLLKRECIPIDWKRRADQRMRELILESRGITRSSNGPKDPLQIYAEYLRYFLAYESSSSHAADRHLRRSQILFALSCLEKDPRDVFDARLVIDARRDFWEGQDKLFHRFARYVLLRQGMRGHLRIEGSSDLECARRTQQLFHGDEELAGLLRASIQKSEMPVARTERGHRTKELQALELASRMREV